MNAIRIRRSRGFTLVEILIVVIILGILAAIVIPQFTNASQDARKNSLTSQLQTIRSQLELYKLQHLDQLPPALVASAGSGGSPACWGDMTVKTNADHTTGGTPQFGPYLQAAPVNPLRTGADASAVFVVTGVTDYGAGGVASPDPDCGFILNDVTGKIWATSAQGGFIYNEGNAADANNDL
jgi:general secretion pathway protein G